MHKNDRKKTVENDETIDVTVDAVADAPTLTVADATGNEDSAIALSIASSLTDTDGSESLSDITISGLPGRTGGGMVSAPSRK